MTPCPICRGRGDTDCLCEDGMVEAEMVNGRPATVMEAPLVGAVIALGVAMWLAGLWLVL